MNRLTFGILALWASTAIGGGASAADAVVYDGPPVAVNDSFNWSGVYVGLVGSAGLFDSTMSDSNENISYGSYDLSDWGWSGGVTLGYNQQFGNAVIGVEGDINWSGFDSDSYDDPYDTQHDRSWDWYSTLRLRAGLAMDRTMIYATGGVAFVGIDFKGDYDPSNACGDYYGYCLDETVVGVALGGGVEHAFTDNISVKGELMWIGLPDEAVDDEYNDDVDNYHVKSSVTMARIGINYRF